MYVFLVKTSLLINKNKCILEFGFRSLKCKNTYRKCAIVFNYILEGLEFGIYINLIHRISNKFIYKKTLI